MKITCKEDFQKHFPITEQEILMTPELAKQIFDAAGEDYEIEEDEKIYTYEYNTGFGKYKYYSFTYADKQIMAAGDFELICQELCLAIKTHLPDGIDDCFDDNALLQKVKTDYTYLDDIVSFLNNKDAADLYYVKDPEEVEVNGIKYIVFKEF